MHIFVLVESPSHVQLLVTPWTAAHQASLLLTIYIYNMHEVLIAQSVKNPPAMQETPGLIPGSGKSDGEGIGYPLQYSWASLVAQLEKNLPATWETWV